MNARTDKALAIVGTVVAIVIAILAAVGAGCTAAGLGIGPKAMYWVQGGVMSFAAGWNVWVFRQALQRIRARAEVKKFKEPKPRHSAERRQP